MFYLKSGMARDPFLIAYQAFHRGLFLRRYGGKIAPGGKY